jgi:hypothetical protein
MTRPIEGLFASDGIDEGYAFTQTDHRITATFSAPDGVDATSAQYRYDLSTRSIFVGFPNEHPILSW